MDRLRLQMLRVVPNLTARIKELGLVKEKQEESYGSSADPLHLARCLPWGPATKPGSHYLGAPAGTP